MTTTNHQREYRQLPKRPVYQIYLYVRNTGGVLERWGDVRAVCLLGSCKFLADLT